MNFFRLVNKSHPNPNPTPNPTPNLLSLLVSLSLYSLY